MVVVDRASSGCVCVPRCIEFKHSLCVAQTFLALLLTFGLPTSIRSDVSGEFTANMVIPLCQWLRMQRDHGPGGQTHAAGQVHPD